MLNGLLWKRTEIILSFWRLHPSTVFQTLVDCEGYSTSSKGFLPTVVDIVVLELNVSIPIHFISLIPKMLMFILAISCLTTSNLPCFMDLTFHVLMQYFCLNIKLYFHHQIQPQLGVVSALAPPLHSFFLQFFLHSAPVEYSAPTDLGAHLSVSYLFAFSFCSWGSQGENAEVVCHSLL